MMEVFEHLLLSLPSNATDSDQSASPKLEQLVVFMTTLCDWSMPTRDTRRLLLDLIERLESIDDRKLGQGQCWCFVTFLLTSLITLPSDVRAQNSYVLI